MEWWYSESRIECVLVYSDSEGLKVKPWRVSDICLVCPGGMCVVGVRAGNLMNGYSQFDQPARKVKMV